MQTEPGQLGPKKVQDAAKGLTVILLGFLTGVAFVVLFQEAERIERLPPNEQLLVIALVVLAFALLTWAIYLAFRMSYAKPNWDSPPKLMKSVYAGFLALVLLVAAGLILIRQSPDAAEG